MTHIKSSDILKEARNLLWDGKSEYLSHHERYICYAIEDAFYALTSREGSARHLRALQNCVHGHLDKCLTIENYVYKKWGKEYHNKLTCEDFQNLRLVLLNGLIEDYESEGD